MRQLVCKSTAAQPGLQTTPAGQPSLAPLTRQPSCARRRPSYHDPTSPTAAGAAAATEEGCAYSHEEEMAGRLHDEMLKESREHAKAAA